MKKTINKTTRFFLLYPTKEKVVVSLGISILLISLFLLFPSFGLQAVFLKSTFLKQLLSLFVSVVASTLIYYPFSCGLVYFVQVLRKKEIITAKNCILAILFMLLFNVLTISILVGNLQKKIYVPSTIAMKNAKTNNNLCGLQIMDVTAPSAKQAGLTIGDIILTVNGYPVSTLEDLTHALANSKAQDIVSLETSKNTYSVPLFANTQDPRQLLLGIMVKPAVCRK